MNTTKKSLIGVATLLALASMQAACGSDDTSGGGTTAGAGGSHAGAAGAATTGGGGAATTGGAPAGGAPTGGAPAGGTGGGAAAGTGGAAAGTGGAAAGSGGTAGGTGGSGGSAGGAGPSAEFAAVKTLFGTSCGVGDCHNAASKNLDYQAGDLHALLTTPIAAGIHSCVGSTPAVSKDANSWLLSVVKMGTACPKGGGNIGKMPDNCNGNKCLSDAQIKVISDWIAAGVPN